MSLRGSLMLKSFCSEEEMFEPLHEIMSRFLLALGQEQKKSLDLKQSSYEDMKNCAFEVNLKFDLDKKAYIFRVIDPEHFEHEFRKNSTVKST
eukprot:snap_masked-scaffold_44-processed-gene-1.34-mRNA-1 protein AED:1.00 eAED:1.00 QI:0/0/0/0/1/1/3/0/92